MITGLHELPGKTTGTQDAERSRLDGPGLDVAGLGSYVDQEHGMRIPPTDLLDNSFDLDLAGRIEKTGNRAAVQRQLGHTNAAYSIQYARVTDQELAEALDDR